MSQGYREPVNESNLIAKLQEVVSRAQQAEGLSDMVMVVLAGIRVLGQMILKMVLEQRDEQMHRERKGPPFCPHCGKKMRKPRKKQVERMTLLGRIRYMRISWLCPNCRRGHEPMDATLGLQPLHKGHSLEFVKELALGINAMLRLRCAWASDRWDDVFTLGALPDEKKPKDYVLPLAA